MAFFRNTPARLLSGALALATVTLATACGPTVSGTPGAAEPDARTFDVGRYSTIPLDYRAQYFHKVYKGNELAAMRLAGFVANGTEVDPSLKFGRAAVGITSARNAGNILAAVDTPILENSNMMFGFSMSAADTDPSTARDQTVQREVNRSDGGNPGQTTSVNIAVIQFPDAGSAAKTATEIEAADFAVAAEANQPVTLEKYPEAKGHWRPGIPTMGVTLSHGDYLINVFVQKPSAEEAGLKSLAQQALSVQLPMLDQLPPLTPRDVVRLDYDPQGMFRRTLQLTGSPEPSVKSEWVMSARGFLHGVTSQDKWRAIIEPSGVDLVSETKNGALLLRARDAAAAATLSGAITGGFKNKASTPQGVPDVICEEAADSQAAERFRCVIRYSRYVAMVVSNQLTDVHQRAAAQYALLANAEWM
ncbi:hypothetical protein LTV02_26790 [Nocardia yamanashiensis]|uniref:DUF7373 family lipoprotein n=1 Tax=Nocardia yamanashiensis TaxID=209247 RepID=UPI001E2DD46D|nr:hypothetical protein [Nocardia yamanashiensis]UGT39649.1 hypothetical protein LTV02_26790 [Nocardia yamanashiensis]